jgi:hypothetical protein
MRGRGGETVGIGFSIFLFVIGAILTLAVDVRTSGFDRRRTVAGDTVVERRIGRDLP